MLAGTPPAEEISEAYKDVSTWWMPAPGRHLAKVAQLRPIGCSKGGRTLRPRLRDGTGRSSTPGAPPLASQGESTDSSSVKTRATNGWLESLEDVLDHVLEDESPQRTSAFLEGLTQRLCAAGVEVPRMVNTPYVNTIPCSEQPEYPGERAIERRISSCIRWNAMAMVVNANGITAASAGTSQHTLRKPRSTKSASIILPRAGWRRAADMIYFQGHATPGNYAALSRRPAHR